LYTIHFELARGNNPAAIYCLVQNKIQSVYDRMFNEVKRMVILALREYCWILSEQQSIFLDQHFQMQQLRFAIFI